MRSVFLPDILPSSNGTYLGTYRLYSITAVKLTQTTYLTATMKERGGKVTFRVELGHQSPIKHNEQPAEYTT